MTRKHITKEIVACDNCGRETLEVPSDRREDEYLWQHGWANLNPNSRCGQGPHACITCIRKALPAMSSHPRWRFETEDPW